MSIGTSGLPNAQAGYRYGTVLMARGGSTPYRWSIGTGTLPSGLSLNAATGQITGTPSAAGVFKFAARVTDAKSASATLALNLNVGPPPLSGPQKLSTAPGWHRIAATAVCGGGPEHNPTFSDPDNFPANLNAAYTSYVSGNHFVGLGGGFASQCLEMMNDSNSGAYDTQRHRLVLFGGGHQHYFGSDVYALDLTTLTMAHLDHSGNPYTCPAMGSPGTAPGTTLTTADGAVCQYNAGSGSLTILAHPRCTYAAGCAPTQPSPGGVHTYNGWLYVPGQDEMVEFSGVSNPYGNSGNDVWTLAASSVLASCAPDCDPQWTRLAGVFPDPNTGNVAAYDPNTQGVWVKTSNDLRYFDPASNTMTMKLASSKYSFGYHSNGVIDPLHKYFILIGPQSTNSAKEGLLYIDISGNNLALQTPATTGCSSLITPATNPNPQYMGLAWDPIGKRVVIYPNAGNTLWYLDPATWTCTSETYGATQGIDYPQDVPITSAGGWTMGTFGHFAYDPTFDAFVLCNDPNNDCWYLIPSR